jgi:anti-anti-sigma factor
MGGLTPRGPLFTVVRLSGELDVCDVEPVSAYAASSAMMSAAILLDMEGIRFFAVQGISLLYEVDEFCRCIDVPWALVASRAVERVLRVSGQADAMPIANSAAVAMRYFAHLACLTARPQSDRNPLAADSR